MNRKLFFGIFVSLATMAISFVPAIADDTYRVGPDDLLEIRFWQDETNRLNANVRVRQDGTISLDIVGEIVAAGQTTSDLEKEIVRKISRFNKSISQAVVRVTDYGYQKVFVSGQVLTPGKYTFEKIPDLWTIINEAGGITEFGDLSRVLIIRKNDGGGNQVEIVDVAKAAATGTIGSLPTIQREDVIEVSRMPGGLPARSVSIPSDARNIFYVTGAVTSPGSQTLEDNMDILSAIAMAGGASETANLKKVKIISRDGSNNSQVVTLNLKKYMESGTPGRYTVHPEDNIFVPARRAGFLGINSITEIAALLGAATTAFLLYDQLTQDDTSR
ncbi:MAG: SLBB domain-containing protein [Candidatus Zixiibacteriota bacterium]